MVLYPGTKGLSYPTERCTVDIEHYKIQSELYIRGYEGSRACGATVRMAQLQLIRNTHIFKARCIYVRRPH